ncbi:hypothetical protein PHYSODRAFT_440125, partial [Phytophthora sojae]
LSFWSPSEGRKGGVAILVDPYGALKDMAPVFERRWGPHFMAVQGRMHGQSLIVLNLYAPHRVPQIETFFRSLADLEFPSGSLVAIGGDFNCTLDEVADRSYTSRSGAHDSIALRELLAAWGAVDPIEETRPLEWPQGALRQHHAETHTYRYVVDGHGDASSRLDRWYVTAALRPWVAGWEVIEPGVSADHHGAKLHLQPPDDPICVKNPAQVHPASDAVRRRTEELLEAFSKKISQSDVTATQLALWWDEVKLTIVKATLNTIKERRRRQRNSSAKIAPSPQPAGAPSGTHGWAGTWPARLRRAIAECQRERSSLHQRRHFADATYWDGKTTKAFSNRVSSKFSDNTIRRLDPVPGAPVRDVH